MKRQLSSRTLEEQFLSPDTRRAPLSETVRLGTQLMLQKAVELEVTEFLGRDHYQRSRDSTFMNERSRLSLMFAVLADASAGWHGVKITPAISRELDALVTDSKANPGVGLAPEHAWERLQLLPRYGAEPASDSRCLHRPLGP